MHFPTESLMAPVVAMINIGEETAPHDGRHEWGPYDALHHIKIDGVIEASCIALLMRYV